ncbi:MAG TPA: PLP-dependent aminotransferase family protein, partial [Gammaproteobacteria bacterium]
ADGHLARHTRRMRALYRERRNALIRSLERLPDAEVLPAQAGLHVTVLLHERKNAARISAAAAKAGVRVQSLDWFALSARCPNGLVCGLGAIPTDRIDAGVKRLAGFLR